MRRAPTAQVASRALALLLVLGGVACRDTKPLGAPDSTSVPPQQPDGRSVYLSVSEPSPEAGATVVVSGNVGDKVSLGSFLVRLEYDPTRLHFVDEFGIPGMLRAVNPLDGEVVVAGAASGPVGEGKLFTLRFRADDPGALNTLLLRVEELNDTDFTDQTQSITRVSRLVHDAALAQGRAGIK